MSGRVTHFEIYGDQPEELAAFYGDLFGWRIERAPGVDYWRIHTDPASIAQADGGVARRPESGPNGWMNFVRVGALDDAIAIAESRGARMLRGKTAVPKTAWYAILADPAGNVFGIWEPDATAFPLPEPD